MAARKAQIVETLPPNLAAEVERAVRAAGALAPAKLTKLKLSPAATRELERALVAAGLERTPSVVRVPLGEQLLALVQAGARVPLRDVAKRVKGGAKKELDAALDKLVRGGQARVVVRTSVEVLVSSADRALSPAEVAEVTAAHAALGKVLKKVTAKGRARSILHDDLPALLGPFERVRRPPVVASPSAAIVAEALRKSAVLDLVRVPDLVRALDGKLTLAEVHHALLAADDAGAIELRPESGTEFLSEEDARLCPPGPRGTVFSYAALVRA